MFSSVLLCWVGVWQAWWGRFCWGELGLVELWQGRHGWQKFGRLSPGKSWCVRVRFVLARQASLGELGYVLYCVEVRRGISR